MGEPSSSTGGNLRCNQGLHPSVLAGMAAFRPIHQQPAWAYVREHGLTRHRLTRVHRIGGVHPNRPKTLTSTRSSAHTGERSRCLHKECGGSQICAHGRQRYSCRDCGGKLFCAHGRYKSRCPDCTPGYIPKETFSSTEAKACAGGVEQAEVHEDCSICLEPLDGEIVTTPCAHTFHSGCIQDWLWRGVAVRCPLCNGDLEKMATKLNSTPREASSSGSSSSSAEEALTSSSSSSSSSSDDEDSEGEEDRTSSDDGGCHRQDEEEDEEEERGDDGMARIR